MAGADYMGCSACGGKAFYDSDVDYGDAEVEALCGVCKVTHQIVVQPRQPAAPQPETREPSYAPTLRPGSWMCFVCHAINGAGVKDCCGHCRPVRRASAPEGDAEPRCTHADETKYRSGIIDCDNCGERLVDPYAGRVEGESEERERLVAFLDRVLSWQTIASDVWETNMRAVREFVRAAPSPGGERET